jgi:ribosomal protein L1
MIAPLLTPRAGVPEVITSTSKFEEMIQQLLNGEGPIKRKGREDDKQIIAMNIGYINHDRARKLLFKLMEENIEKWWD